MAKIKQVLKDKFVKMTEAQIDAEIAEREKRLVALNDRLEFVYAYAKRKNFAIRFRKEPTVGLLNGIRHHSRRIKKLEYIKEMKQPGETPQT